MFLIIRTVITGGFESDKANSLLHLINHELGINKKNLFGKGIYEPKYQLLINKRKQIGTNYFTDPKAITEYSNNINGVYANIDEYNPGKNAEY